MQSPNRGAESMVVLLLLACRSPAPQPGDTSGDEADPCGAAEVLDGEACVPAACGVGPWGDLSLDADTVYVDGVTNGDGSPESPLATIQAGADLAASRGGGMVAIAAGTYVENVALANTHDGVHLAGRCAALVTIDGSADAEASTVTVVGQGRTLPAATLSGFRITGGYVGLRFGRAVVTVRSTIITENERIALWAGDDATVDLDQVELRDTLASSDGVGRGLDVEDGATLTASGCLIEDNVQIGVYTSGSGTSVTLVDTTVRGTTSDRTGRGGYGVDVQRGASLTMSGGAIEANAGFGALVAEAPAAAEFTGTRIDGTVPLPDGSAGYGVIVYEGGRVRLAGATISDNTLVGVYAEGDGTSVELEGTRVTATHESDTSTHGAGVAAVDGADVVATSCTLDGNFGVGLVATGSGATARLVDTTITGTLPHADGEYGRGLQAESGASITAEGCVIDGNAQSAVFASGAGTVVDLTDTSMSGTLADLNGVGRGLTLQEGAAATVTGCRVDANLHLGIIASGSDTTLVVEDTTVSSTAAWTGDSTTAGLAVEGGAAATASRVSLLANATTGVRAKGEGTSVSLQDCLVEGTFPGPEGQDGIGVYVLDGARAEIEASSLRDNANFGLYAVDSGTSVEMVGGDVTRTSARDDGRGGYGVGAVDGATVDVVGSTIEASVALGAWASGAGADMILSDVHVVGTRRGRAAGIASGVLAQEGAALRATGGSITATAGPGAFASDASLALDGATISGNQYSGAIVVGRGAELELTRTTITDTAPDAEYGGGFGVYASSIIGAPTLVVADSVIGPHPYAAVWLQGAGTYLLTGNDLSGSAGVQIGATWAHGNAVFAEGGVTAWDGASGLLLASNDLRDAPGVAVLLDRASAALDGNDWSGNRTDLWQQACDGVTPVSDEELADVPTWERCPTGNLLVDRSISFETAYLPDVTIGE